MARNVFGDNFRDPIVYLGLLEHPPLPRSKAHHRGRWRPAIGTPTPAAAGPRPTPPRPPPQLGRGCPATASWVVLGGPDTGVAACDHRMRTRHLSAAEGV